MTLARAHQVRDQIRQRGLRCVVPLGHGPDGYFARICGACGVLDFYSPDEAQHYLAGMFRKKMRAIHK